MNRTSHARWWTTFLNGDGDNSDASILIESLRSDEELFEDVVQDGEVDSLLRELGRSGASVDPQPFVDAVLIQLESETVVEAPPRWRVPADRVAAPTPGKCDLPCHGEMDGDTVTDPIGTMSWPWGRMLAVTAAIVLLVGLPMLLSRWGTPPRSPGGSRAEMGEGSEVNVAGGENAGSANTSSVATADRHAEDRTAEVFDDAPVDAAIASDNRDGPLQSARGLEPPSAESSPATRPNNGPVVADLHGPATNALIAASSDAGWYMRPRDDPLGQPLSLQRGTAEFQLASGVTFELKAPAEFEIDSSNSLLLARGHVTANVPPAAVGFVIDSPAGSIIDLSTRFNVEVAPSGTAVHVVEGKVAIQPAVEDGRTERVLEGERRFLGTDGAIDAWKILVAANVFGEVSMTINGQPMEPENPRDFDAVQERVLAALSTPPDRDVTGCYLFNGHPQLGKASSPADERKKLIADLERLREIMTRAQAEQGWYQINDKTYPFTGLEDKLRVRRKIARIHGSRALGGRFWEQEKFELDAVDAETLYARHLELNNRVSFFDTESAEPKRTPYHGQPRVSVFRAPPDSDVGVDRLDDETALVEGSDVAGDASLRFDADAGDRRNESLKALEQIRRRKTSGTRGVSPTAESETSREAPSDSAEEGGESKLQTPPSDRFDASMFRKPRPKVRDLGGKDPEQSSGSPDRIVEAALEAELRGDQQARDELLLAALLEQPDHHAANWHSGRIKLGRKWLGLEDAQQHGRSNPVLAAYIRKRSEYGGTPLGELHLARWCRTRRPDASQMYYTRLLRNPQVTNQAVRLEAANHLNLVPYQGAYISPQQRDEREAFLSRRDRAERLWNPRLSAWSKRLRSQSRAEDRQQVIDQIGEVDDPDIALIAWDYATRGGEEFGLQMIDLLDRFSSPECTLCMARFGVLSPWQRVRESSADAVSDRRLHDYVPELLGLLIGKRESEGRVDRLLDGTIVLRHVFRQENARTNSTQVTTRTALPRINFDPVVDWGRSGRQHVLRHPDHFAADQIATGDPYTYNDRFIEQMLSAELAKRDAATLAANVYAKMANQRIYDYLSRATGEEIADQENAWWDWWQDYNEIRFDKSHHTYLDQAQFAYTAYNLGPRYQVSHRSPPPYVHQHSCFVAGTSIATETGMRPVDEITAGDRVFSQDVDSGELTLETVLVTTKRVSPQIVELLIEDELIRTTPGHPFWVNGKGWKMAKLLKKGDQLHGMRGVLTLNDVRVVPHSELVYNLVVKNIGNYFVGDSLALAHDNTFRRPTDAAVPGL